ncbi:aspartic peptidase domain-containing protein [Dichomitus squalens]|uniref:Aspartic peptidase domain-containing protein n=1 Tax=Dichomitus squalens TaxID=114155 RepID=A0A4Q9NDJ6_9APHY|nr:aspartic peptidase domain-containing protein [Dichomitus squalens]TBU38327.1 aspartic peptidase domain-containing protein [Dichomitus squalens]TBU55738.1 aspartic peptidase domain-containing protein [Dichomitus squalens]
MHIASTADAQRTSARKGKQRDLSLRDEGDGAADGVVVDLTLITDSLYQATYVVPISLGIGLSKHQVQVDTGSSDLWLASTACSSSACNAVGGQRYDPSGSTPTNQRITLSYADGEADGPIVWDTVQLGGYSIDNQALGTFLLS